MNIIIILIVVIIALYLFACLFLPYNVKKKQRMKTAEEAVNRYIENCQRLENMQPYEYDTFMESDKQFMRNEQLALFSEMKKAVDVCPRKFRDKMALRLTIAGYT